MKRIFLLCTFIFLLIGQSVQAKTLLYIPADNRPVSFSYVTDTAKAAGVEIITPQEALLAGRGQPGNPDRLWDWLVAHINSADAVVISADSLIYGSLVDSRTHHFSEDSLAERLAKFEKIRQMNSTARIYVFSTLMRTPQDSDGGVEPAYYEKYGPSIFQLTALQDKQELGMLAWSETQSIQTLAAEIPQPALADWFDRRAKNFKMNSGLVALVKNGCFDYLIIGRDDCSPFSQSHKESRLLAKQTQKLSANKFASFPGADQLGMLLVARAINDFYFQIPIVAVTFAPGAGGKTVPTYEDAEIGQTVIDQITAAGGIPLSSSATADLLLAVSTPEDGLTREAGSPANRRKIRPGAVAFVSRLEQALATGQQVALASIAFSNGADNALMAEMAQRGLFPRLAAFSGWNTASNTIGFAIGQGLLAKRMNLEDKKRLLAVRLLDDWAYQANVRGRIAESVLWPLGGNYFYLNDLRPLLAEEAERYIQLFADSNLKDFRVKAVQVSFPWDRMFEIDVKTK